MNQSEALSRVRTAALVSELLRVLEESNVTVSTDVEKRLYDAAEHFDEKTATGAAIRRHMAEAHD